MARNVFDYLVELESEEAVRTLQPDFERLAALGHGPLDVEIGEGASPAVLNCI
jgi:predicted PhzF superfamily epimerase YddE/YHI9